MKMQFLTTHEGHVRQAFVGSRSIFNAGKDTDIMWLVKDALDAVAFLEDAGYSCDFESYGGANKFLSCRKDDINVIVTHDEAYYEGSRVANEVCKFLKLAEKEERIAVFEIIRDGRPADGYDGTLDDIPF